jgi:hypothetical protein
MKSPSNLFLQPGIKLAMWGNFGLVSLYEIHRASMHVPLGTVHAQDQYVLAKTISALIVGAIIAGLVWLVAQVGYALRLREHHAFPALIGTIAFGVACVFVLIFLIRVLYYLSLPRGTLKGGYDPISNELLALNLAFLFWLAGGGIRYMLRGEDVPRTPDDQPPKARDSVFLGP